MLRSLALTTVCISILTAVSQQAAADQTTLFFDPADFYDFRPLDPGPADTWSPEGGMFKLHELWNTENSSVTTLRSWLASDRSRLDDWSQSLEVNEGIGFFNIDLNQLGEGLLWGQTLQTPFGVTGLIAPPGWSAEIRGNSAAWTASSSAFYIRPDTATYNDGDSFGFSFNTAEQIPLQSEETVWFGGFNYLGFEPALTFSSWGNPPGFSSVNAQPGTGFEATLRLVRDTLDADFNDDGIVDGSDFLIWQSNFIVASGAEHDEGDADYNGTINGQDYLIWQQQFLQSVGGGASAASVPEPAAVILVSCFAACVLAFVRRSR